MADKRPRVIGLRELLKLRRSLRESPAPLVYFSGREFARLIRTAVELPRRPSGPPLASFDPWPGGGMVQSRCESPPGQVCFGRWTPAGPGRGQGIYFECVCRPEPGGPPPPPEPPCQLLIAPTGAFQCAGTCADTAQGCRLGVWKDPSTGRFVLDCRCGPAFVVSGRPRQSLPSSARAARISSGKL